MFFPNAKLLRFTIACCTARRTRRSYGWAPGFRLVHLQGGHGHPIFPMSFWEASDFAWGSRRKRMIFVVSLGVFAIGGVASGR